MVHPEQPVIGGIAAAGQGDEVQEVIVEAELQGGHGDGESRVPERLPCRTEPQLSMIRRGRDADFLVEPGAEIGNPPAGGRCRQFR